jgi:hypothetical protein
MVKSAGNPFESTQPARSFFVGRSNEVAELQGYLDTVQAGGSTNLFVLGAGGSGKTSFLHKVLEEAASRSLVAALITINSGMESDQIIFQLIEAQLDAIRKLYNKKEYVDDFHRGAESSFQVAVAHSGGRAITSRDVEKDLEFLQGVAERLELHGFVLCLDEGHWLKEIQGGGPLGILRGAIQTVGSGFMIVLASLEDIIPGIAAGAPGVDRFFPNRIDLGPFEDSNVAIAAIEKRLDARPVSFLPGLSARIAQISNRNPKEIVDICKGIYARALRAHDKQGTSDMLREVVYQQYAPRVTEVIEALALLGRRYQPTMKSLLQNRSGATIRDLVLLQSHSQDEDLFMRVEHSLRQELPVLIEKRLCTVTPLDGADGYTILDELTAFILSIELGMGLTYTGTP